MIEFTNSDLLYRATADGFEAKSFHAKCDGKANTITIIKTNGNYVFGGYTAAEWTIIDYYGTYIADSKAFIFSLRRNGISCNHKLMVKTANHAIYGYLDYEPTFGGGHDIYIKDQSNTNIGSITNLSNSYDYPPENGDSNSFLAGSYNGWLTTEIEVYQINN